MTSLLPLPKSLNPVHSPTLTQISIPLYSSMQIPSQGSITRLSPSLFFFIQLLLLRGK